MDFAGEAFADGPLVRPGGLAERGWLGPPTPAADLPTFNLQVDLGTPSERKPHTPKLCQQDFLYLWTASARRGSCFERPFSEVVRELEPCCFIGFGLICCSAAGLDLVGFFVVGWRDSEVLVGVFDL